MATCGTICLYKSQDTPRLFIFSVVFTPFVIRAAIFTRKLDVLSKATSHVLWNRFIQKPSKGSCRYKYNITPMFCSKRSIELLPKLTLTLNVELGKHINRCRLKTRVCAKPTVAEAAS